MINIIFCSFYCDYYVYCDSASQSYPEAKQKITGADLCYRRNQVADCAVHQRKDNIYCREHTNEKHSVLYV